MRTRIALTAGFLLAAVLLAAAPAQAQIKIGVFDPQRVSEESAQGKRLQAQLTALQQTKQSELKIKQQALADLEKTFNEQRISLSAERRNELQREIERSRIELDNAKNLAQQELQLEFQDAQQQFNVMLVRGIQAFGEAEGFDLILDMAAVAYMAQTIDVTTAVIDHLDRMFPVSESQAPGSAPGS